MPKYYNSDMLKIKRNVVMSMPIFGNQINVIIHCKNYNIKTYKVKYFLNQNECPCMQIVSLFTFQVGNNHDGGKESQFQISVSAAGSIIGLTTFFVLTFRLVSSKLEKCRREAISSDSAVY